MIVRVALWIFSVLSPLVGGVLLAQSESRVPCSSRDFLDTERVVRIAGELTRKGSDFDSWWSLIDEAGVEYKLELMSEALEKSFFEWQNQKVTVVGKPGGKFLSLNIICVSEAYLD
jgi:hypothetical protein